MSNAVESAYDRILGLAGFEWDDWTRENLQIYRPRHVLMAESIERHLRGPRETIADVGCHNGFFLRLASELGFRRMIAVDFFELPPARSFLRNLPGVEFLHRNFNEPGFFAGIPDASLDCVASTEVFEHLFNHPLGYLEESWRVVRPGGLLLLTTPHPATLANAWRLLRNQPIQWGAVAFAETKKILDDGSANAMWDIHFREYFDQELTQIVAKLPGADIVERGFIATGPSTTSGPLKRFVKQCQHRLGLGRSRLLSTTQYQILRKRG